MTPQATATAPTRTVQAGGPGGAGELFAPGPDPRPRWLTLWVGLVFAVFTVAVLHEALGPYLFSHDGYNGSAFAQAARNSLRFGVLEQAQYYTGTAPPPLSEIYTNHPLLLHLQLILLFAIGGVEEWVGRLVPVLYSLGFLVLLYRVTARRFSPLTAAVAITIWTLTPLHTIYANMINHEQGGLFWCLLLAERYLVWLVRRRGEWSIHLAVTMAMQYDWPGYYFALFIGLHALCEALMPQRVAAAADPASPEARWAARPLWRRGAFLSRFSLVVLLNAALFFGWIAALRGGLSAMWAAFALRSGNIEGYGSLLWHRSLDLYGGLLLAILSSWALWAAWRFVRGRARRRDLIPWFFFFGQLIHTTVFKSAGAIHAYWTFYVGPALAIGGASLLVALWQHRARLRPPPLRVIVPLFFVAAALAQGWYAVRQHLWGYATHRAAYMGPVSDEWLDVQWAKALAERYGRDGTCYLIHGSADRRVHVTYYLDAPRVEGFEPIPGGEVPVNVCQAPRRIALFDLEKLHLHQVGPIWDVVLRHRSFVWNRRFVAVEVDVRRDPERPEVLALAWVEEAPPLWWSWLVNSRNPPGYWSVDASTGWWPSHTEAAHTPWAGSRAGFPALALCPPDEVVVGLRLPSKDGVVAAVELVCRPLHAVLRRQTPPPDELPGSARLGRLLPWAGSPSACQVNAVGVGLHGRAGLYLDTLGLACRPARKVGRGVPKLGASQDAPARGGGGGTGYRLTCPDGSVLTGVAARTATAVHALAPVCSPLDTLSTVNPAPELPEEPGPEPAPPESPHVGPVP